MSDIQIKERDLIVRRLSVICEELGKIRDVYKMSLYSTEKGLIDIQTIWEKINLLCLSIQLGTVEADYRISEEQRKERKKKIQELKGKGKI